jgi:hypothetical protein
MSGPLDSVYSAPVPPDQQPTPAKAAAASSQKTSDTFVIERSGLNVVANGVYAFSFSYKYLDPNNPSNVILGPRSANFRFTLEAPDYTVPVQNLTVTSGTLSYIAKWDPIDKSLEANKWFIDAQIYESTTGAFTGEEYLVWNGTGNTATVLVSDLADRWIRVDTRDQDYHKKSVVRGPFRATDPIIVDTTGPGNVTSVTTSGGIDTSGYMGFNGYATISWPAVTGNGIRGYRIRFSNDNDATYSYVDSPGTGTTYKLGGLAVGATYKIAVATYDEYNNTSSSYVSGSDVTISGVPAITNYITAGNFQFGVGVGSVSTNKGLYFDASNYWLINATNSARLKVGGTTENYLFWDGAKFTIDGDISARGGTFTGNVLMSNPSNGKGASIYSGTINPATGALTGNGFALNSTGLKVANGSNSITLDAATGTITANAGTISGWTMSGTTLSKNNVILDSAGKIQVGAAANTSVYIQSVAGTSPTKTYVMWAGNNTPDSNAKFKVGADGVLYATGAVFGTGTTVPGYATSGELTTTNNNVTALGTTVTNQGTTLATKLTKSTSTITDSSNNITAINANGITVFSNGSSTATSPGNGARVVMNSDGIAAYNSLNQPTFSISASTGDATFKGSGEFGGKITASSGSIGGWTISASGWLTGYGTTLGGANFAISTETTYGISSGRFSATDDTTQSIFRGGAIIGPSNAAMSVSTAGQVTLSSSSPGAFFYPNTTIGATSSNTLTVNARATFGSDLVTEGANNATTLTASPNVYMTSAGVIRKTSGSSLRYKKDVVDLISVENLNPIKLYDLPVRAFKFKEEFLGDDDSRYDKLIPGFIAEEVEQVYPIAADYDNDGVEKWNVQVMIPSMLALIQSINIRLDALEV